MVEVARRLVALHSTDPASVFLSAAARMRNPAVADIERALYDDRSLVRILGMRRTVFVVADDLAGVVQAACTRALCAGERRKLVQLLEEGGIAPAGGGEAWLRRAESETLEALRAKGEATASELSAEVAALREELHFGAGKKWEGVQRVSTRVLFLLAAQGAIVRGRPRGSWSSSQYRWAPAESWLPQGWADGPVDEAQPELARRWLQAFGPAPAGDLRWWTGWTARDTKAALARAGAIEVDLDGIPGMILPADGEPEAPSEPWAALLPALDPTVMGWSAREWYLGELGPALFDRSGNAGPTVWWNGRIVGGWAQRKDGEVAVRLLADVGGDGKAAVDDAAGALRQWLGEMRITPRFGTPLVKELMA